MEASSSVMSRYSCMDSTHCLASTASRISSARCFLPFSTFAFSSACSFCVFSSRRLKFATSHFKDFNSLLEVLREQVLSQYQPTVENTALKALEAMQVQEEDYFCQVTHRTWDAILHDIRNIHKDDTDSAQDGSNALKLIKDAKKALAVPGSYLDVFTALMCTQLQIRYEKLTEQERTVLKNVMKKTPAYNDSPLSRMKRR